MTPETTSPSWPENSSKTASRSASRRRCSTTCFAVCAAMRPAVALTWWCRTSVAPSVAAGFSFCAASRSICSSSSAMSSSISTIARSDQTCMSAVDAVDLDVHLADQVVLALVGGGQRGLHRLEDDVDAEILLGGELGDREQEIGLHGPCPSAVPLPAPSRARGRSRLRWRFLRKKVGICPPSALPHPCCRQYSKRGRAWGAPQ